MQNEQVVFMELHQAQQNVTYVACDFLRTLSTVTSACQVLRAPTMHR